MPTQPAPDTTDDVVAALSFDLSTFRSLPPGSPDRTTIALAVTTMLADAVVEA